MRRAPLAWAAVAFLGLSAAWAPAPAASGVGVLGSIGRSMGGARVMLIDALFLRAEAQRKAGRIDEAAAIYETVLELDPDNEAATIFLVNVYVDELIAQVPDLEERFAWWLEGRALLARALRRRPRAAGLHARAASLILDAVYADERFLPLLERELGRPDVVALGHLEQAALAAATLPRQGRGHLVRFVHLAPLVAAQAVRDGQPVLVARALASIDQVLARRDEVLAELRLEDQALDCRAILRLARAAVVAADAARTDPGARAALRAQVEALRSVLPPDLVQVLEELAK